MFSYEVFELIASFGSIRDYVRMMRIAISDAPSDLVERRCATYKKTFNRIKQVLDEAQFERVINGLTDSCVVSGEYNNNYRKTRGHIGIMYLLSLPNVCHMTLTGTKQKLHYSYCSSSSIMRYGVRLKTLSMSDCHFRPERMLPWRHLQSLQACRCFLKDDHMEHFRSLHSLRTLDVSDNSIGDRGADILSGLSLVNLNLSRNNVTRRGVVSFRFCERLNRFRIDLNRVWGRDMLVLLDHPCLRELYLSVHVCREAMQHFNNQDRIEVIYV